MGQALFFMGLGHVHKIAPCMCPACDMMDVFLFTQGNIGLITISMDVAFEALKEAMGDLVPTIPLHACPVGHLGKAT